MIDDFKLPQQSHISQRRDSHEVETNQSVMTCLPYYIGISQPVNIVFFLVNILCSLVSIIGNSLTTFVVATRSHLQMPRNLLLAALSVTDLFAGLVAQPIFGTYLSFFHNTNSCMLEKAIVFMSASSCASSLLLLCVIARDRYLHVAKGLQYNQHTSKYQVGEFIHMIVK